MSEAPPPIDDDDAALAELMAKDLAAVRHVHAQLMATTDTDEINSLGRTYQRAARSLRQTIALKAKLRRDVAGDARRAAEQRAELMSGLDIGDGLHEWRIGKRLEAVQDAVGRVIGVVAGERPEAERPDWITDLYARFDRELDGWTVHRPRAFMELGVDSVVRDMCARLRLPPHLAATWSTLPPATWAPDPVEATPDRPPAEPPAPPWPETG